MGIGGKSMKNKNAAIPLAVVEKAIRQFAPEQQRKLLLKLPRLLKLPPEELELLCLAETSFKFWNNSADSVYDAM